MRVLLKREEALPRLESGGREVSARSVDRFKKTRRNHRKCVILHDGVDATRFHGIGARFLQRSTS
jgi:hypothetical protein